MTGNFNINKIESKSANFHQLYFQINLCEAFLKKSYGKMINSN